MSSGDTSSGDPKRVLHVDEDGSVPPRLAGALEGRPGTYEVVGETDPRDGLARLDTTTFDCLVSGYDLAGMDGIEFLERVRETNPDIPFVLFTGSGDEAVASRAISAGVTDYVRKCAENEGVESLAERVRTVTEGDDVGSDTGYGRVQFSRFVETFPDVVFLIDEEGRYVDLIASGNDSLLYDDPENLLGSRFREVLPGTTADRFHDVVERALGTGEQQRIEYQLDVRSGTRWFEARIGPLQTAGERRTVFWIARDITERKRREREYEQIFNSVKDAITVFDPDSGEITEVNEAYREMLGYDLERIRELGIDGLSANDERYTGDRGWDLIREVSNTGETRTVEWQAETSAGDRVWLEVKLTPGQIGGKRRVLSIQRDITKRRELERTYRNIFENVSDGLVIHDPDTGEILEVNEQYCELTGYDRDELLEETIELILTDDPDYTYDDAIERIRTARAEGPQLFEFRGERKSGDVFVGEVHLSTIEIRGNERVLASVRDITERKRREREYEQIFNGVNDAIVVQDPETAEPIDANETFVDRLGYDDVSEIRETGLEGLSATDSRFTKERAQELCRRVMETGESEIIEWQQETKTGTHRWIEAKLDSATIRGENRVLSMQRDITGRKRRERAIEALQEATERLQTATSRDEVATIAVEAAGDVLDLPLAICWFHDGADRLEPVEATESVSESGLVSGLSADRYEYQVFSDGTVTEYTPSDQAPDNQLETGVLLPLGTHGLVAATTRQDETVDEAVLDIAKALADHVTTALDRVERAQAVRESERRFRLIAERIDEVILLATPDFSKALYVNPAYESVWGRPVEELYDDAMSFLEAIDPRDREATRAEIEAMVEEMERGNRGDSYDFEYRIRRPGGEVRWVSATGYAVEMSNGEPRFVGIVEDITERKMREQRLEVFNRILRHNLRNNLDVIRSHAEALSDRTESDHAETIVSSVDKLAAMGAKARRIDRIMSKDDTPSEIDMSETVHETLDTMASTTSEVTVTTDLQGGTCLRTNEETVTMVLESALENALTHAESRVTVSLEDSPEGCVLVVADDGPGIPEEELVPIETGTETTLQHGRGLGLWQLRWGVDTLNGELSFETGPGTTVRILIPDQRESVPSE